MIRNIRKCIHPILLKAIKRQRKHELHILNDCPQINGNALYSVNHSCRYDFPYAAEAIKHHSYVLVGRQRLDLMDRMALYLNGAVYVDRKSRYSKTKVKSQLKTLLRNGNNLIMFPEGTWNLTPSKPMLPLYWGIIDMAREAKCPIIPLVLEYKDQDCYIKYGEPICVKETDTKQEKIEELSDVMARLKWDVWEMFPIMQRREFDGTEWEKEKCRRLAEYPKLDYSYEKSIIRN